MTASIHKLTAGSGYDYLTRQVAVMDATAGQGRGHRGLASYYSERGEIPGQWLGSGMAGVTGLRVGDEVTADQMLALFGLGRHPLAVQRMDALEGPGLRPEDFGAVSQLGAPFKVYDSDVTSFQVEVAERIRAWNAGRGLPKGSAVPVEERAAIRTRVAREFFVTGHGREPVDERELAASVARHTRPKTTTVAGYDVTFSPVKSVSSLWALAPGDVAARIERAHRAAIGDALAFVEQHALFTRLGAGGVRQVQVRGLVAAAFTHRDSRAGDPDLHTHVAVANKVQTEDGRWLAIDGRMLFKATVAMSETYNTALEKHLHADLGLVFADRAGAAPRKRPVREVVGVDPALNARWSSRRAAIQTRQGQLSADFQRRHGRPPSPTEAFQLAQQATLQTRDAKHAPRTLTEQRTAWAEQAAQVLGGPQGVRAMVHAALTAGRGRPAAAADAAWFARTAGRILTQLQQRRATWQVWHVRAEAQRQLRATDVPLEQVDAAVDLLTAMVLDDLSVPIGDPGAARPGPPGEPPQVDAAGAGRPVEALPEPTEPVLLRRRDGASQYSVAGSALYTSAGVLAAEARIVAAAGRGGGRRLPAAAVEAALARSAASGLRLNSGQADLVRRMGCSGARVQLAVAPAGSGKTTAMATLTRAWTAGGGTVVGLAPSAAAAAVLREQIGADTDTLAMLITALERGVMPDWAARIGPDTLVVIDEAGMADTLSLDTAIGHVLARGGSVRLIGDDQQLASVGAGGVLRDIATTHGAIHLRELMRFADPVEAAATLALREGRPEALGFYLDNRRVHVGDHEVSVQEVFTAWRADVAAGLDAIMLAPTRELVAELNARARAHRLQGGPEPEPELPACRGRRAGLRRGVRPLGTGRRRPALGGRSVVLADGNQARVGDLVITRENRRRLRVSATDWVKNGDRWTITGVDGDGGLTVVGTRHGLRVRLPAEYAATHTELGYASTIHAAQGLSVDTMHGLVDGHQTRQQLYTMMTRGARANHLYLQVVGDGDPHTLTHPDTVHPLTATDQLERILATDGTPASATGTAREAGGPARRLAAAAARYTDAIYVAAEEHLGTAAVAALKRDADRLVPGLSDQPGWPGLRAHLILLAACGADPVQAIQGARDARGLDTARDVATVLEWRLDRTGLRRAGAGPLPWLPGIPEVLRGHPTWAPYLTQRADLTRQLADMVDARARADLDAGHLPGWAGHTRHANTSHSLSPALAADIAIWRAGAGVADTDLRPTGPRQSAKTAADHQDHLDRRLGTRDSPAMREWAPLLAELGLSRVGGRPDPFMPTLAEHLATMSRAGIDAAALARSCAAGHPFPDDHPAAALWWRLHRHLPATCGPAALTPTGPAQAEEAPPWMVQFNAHVGADTAAGYRASPWWPALVAVIDEGQRRGWPLPALLGPQQQATGYPGHAGHVDGATRDDGPHAGTRDWSDACAVLTWRLSVLLDPDPDPDRTSPAAGHVADVPAHVLADVREDVLDADSWAWTRQAPPPEPPEDLDDHALPPDPADDRRDVPQLTVAFDPDAAGDADEAPVLTAAAALALAEQRRWYADDPQLTSAEIEAAVRRDLAWLECPVTRDRLLAVNEAANRFFTTGYHAQHPNGGHGPGAWARAYLTRRFRIDLADHPDLDAAIQPGQAPAGWDTLVTHLRALGFTDEELLTAGVATTASTGRVIDRFRDRVIFPITHTPSVDPGSGAAARPEILGFVGRRNPAHDPAPGHPEDLRYGPKYLNTAETPLFCKGAQLYVAGQPRLARGATMVLVEGPMDAIAVTIAGSITGTIADAAGRRSELGGRYVGVAPLGTSLTDQQAAQLARLHRAHATAATNTNGTATPASCATTDAAAQRPRPRQPMVATDADIPGRIAAERDYWLLTLWHLDPSYAALSEGGDPAGVLADHGPDQLAAALDHAQPLAETLTHERLSNLPPDQGLREAAKITAARPADTWEAAIASLTTRLAVSTQQAEHALQTAVGRWDADPQRVAARAVYDAGQLRGRAAARHDAAHHGPHHGAHCAAYPAADQGYVGLAASLDPRLPTEPDWPALHHVLHAAHTRGHDLPTLLRELTEQAPLGRTPARELRYRLLVNHPDLLTAGPVPPAGTGRTGRSRRHPEDRNVSNRAPDHYPAADPSPTR